MTKDDNDPDVTKFNDVFSMISEFFPEALLIVRIPDGTGLFWRSTDSTWAMGAANRYCGHVAAKDEADRQRQEQGEE